MSEFNLLEKAGISQIKNIHGIKKVSNKIKKISKKQGFDYYDGDRLYGFGGYFYDGRWKNVAKIAKERYDLNEKSKVLIDRGDKGFLVYDFKKLIPGITIYGTHNSFYSLNHVMDGLGRYNVINNKKEKRDPKIIEQIARDEVNPFLIYSSPLDIPFKDNYFDTVISINSVLNYHEKECRKAIREIIRVSKNNGGKSYIHTDSWKNNHEKRAMLDWVVLSETFLNTNQWEKLFREEGFKGDWGFIRFVNKF